MPDLPRYGPLPAVYRLVLKDERLKIPPDWQLRESDNRARKAAWNDWFESIVKTLDRVLWPAFERRDRRSNVQRAERRIELTRNDLDLMKALASQMGSPVASTAGIDEPQHGDLYLKEDTLGDHGDMADTLAFYAPFLTGALGSAFVGSMATARERKLGSLTLQLKVIFERPRAYQASVLLGKADGFAHQLAVSGCTPAFISGHCIQALMSATYLYERLVAADANIAENVVTSLQQHAVDIGDRRVFAGVHYPSDSLGSWLVALSLAPHVFPPSSDALVQSFLRSAIMRSRVFRALVDCEDPVYEEALVKLKTLIRSPTEGGN